MWMNCDEKLDTVLPLEEVPIRKLGKQFLYSENESVESFCHIGENLITRILLG